MCAGVDLLDYGLAHTVLVSAVADGLANARVTFTLPPVQNSSGADVLRANSLASGQTWNRVAAADIGAANRSLTTAGDVDQMTMAAAAKNLILLS